MAYVRNLAPGEVENLDRPMVVSPELVLHVLDVMRDLNVNECNGRYQQLVVRRIVQTGRPIEALTVGDLLELVRDAADEFELQAREWEARFGAR